jgi:hypothetical protein
MILNRQLRAIPKDKCSQYSTMPGLLKQEIAERSQPYTQLMILVTYLLQPG